MNIQRLRNLTTGILHTEIGHVYEDIELLTGTEGIFTHQLPNACRALEPWLRTVASDERFWDGKFDQSHTGDIELPAMTDDEKEAYWERFRELPSLLAGKEVIVVHGGEA